MMQTMRRITDSFKQLTIAHTEQWCSAMQTVRPPATCVLFKKLFVAALRSRCGHYIFVLWFLTWCGLSANLGCRSETCCTRLVENTGRQKSPKIRHLGIIAQLCRAISSQLRHIDNRKRLYKQQHLPHISSQYDERRPTSGWDRFVTLGHPSKFRQVSRLGFVTAATSLNRSEPNFVRCLAVSCNGTLYIHFRGLLPREGILPGAKFTLRPSLALSYISSVTARYSSSKRQPNFAALTRRRHLYSAGRPSRWASAHILVVPVLFV